MDDDDDLVEGKATKQAVPSFDPHRVFNGARVYRDMAKYCMRQNSFDVARDKLDVSVSFSKKDDDSFESLYLRAKCFDKTIDIQNAIADCERAQSVKNHPHLAYLKGSLLYKQNRFEDALSTFSKSSRPKGFPDRFDYGKAMVTGTMQNCVGRNAGPLGKFILEMKVRTAPKSGMNGLKMNTNRMEKNKKALSEKYLGSLAGDKKMMSEIVLSPLMLGENEAEDVKCRQFEKNTIEKLNYLENCLWQRKPLYCYGHLRMKPSPRRVLQVKELKRRKKKIAAQEVDRQMNKMLTLYYNEDWGELYRLAEYLRAKVWSVPNDYLMCRNEHLFKIIDLVGGMYLQMKTFRKRWSLDWNDKRLVVMIGLERPRTAVFELCRDSFHAPVIDVKAKIGEYAEYHRLAEDEYQMMYYNYEIACLYSMLGMWREARSYSKTSIFDARKQRNIVWYINALFVFARSEVQDGSYHNAMVTFVAVREACKRYGFREQEEFFNRVLTILHREPVVERVPQVMQSTNIREQQIVHLMPDFELKSQAKSLFNRINKRPPWRKMQLMKGSPIPVGEKEEHRGEMKVAVEEREMMKDERVVAKKAKAQAAAAAEKKEQTTISAIDGVDNYMMRKLIDRYKKSSFNIDNFQM